MWEIPVRYHIIGAGPAPLILRIAPGSVQARNAMLDTDSWVSVSGINGITMMSLFFLSSPLLTTYRPYASL